MSTCVTKKGLLQKFKRVRGERAGGGVVVLGCPLTLRTSGGNPERKRAPFALFSLANLGADYLTERDPSRFVDVRPPNRKFMLERALGLGSELTP